MAPPPSPLPIPASGDRPVIGAAGALPWRRRGDRLEVALVHRPAYDDWSWAKGKLDPGEDWPVAAVREVEEETGLQVRLGRPLPLAEYSFVDKRGQVADKQVRYWAGEVVGGHGRLLNEIDEVAWLDVPSAMTRLDYARDREQLRAVVRHDQAGTLETWPLAIVRHAKAVPRGKWSKDDWLRPLDATGRARAEAIVPLLAAFGVDRLVTSGSTRCVETLASYAEATGRELHRKTGLSEEGYHEHPDKAVRHLRRALERAVPTALCSHGPVLPDLLEALQAHLPHPGDPQQGADAAEVGTAAERDAIAEALHEAADLGMAKGEVVVLHLVGRGATAQVVAVERHLP